MLKNEIKILIVDDDVAFGAGIREALAREGFNPILVHKPEDAISQLKVHAISLAIIDCMLPKMNGRDLAKKMDEEGAGGIPKILMSGIFRDKNFIKESLIKTGAKSFISKPVELPDVIRQVNDCIGHLIDIPVSPVNELMTKSAITPGERLKAINESETVHGFELPWIFAILMHQKISGILNILSAEGDPALVGFKSGEIIQVANRDQKSYFGVLLVEHGFIEQEELDAAMHETVSVKKLGERLVDANLLSPHAISIVMAEQQGIRLGKIVGNTSVKISFVETDELREEANIDTHMLNDIFNDWVTSKFPVNWIKTFYTPWMRHKIVPGPDHSDLNRTLSGPAVLRASKFLPMIAKGVTIESMQVETGLSDYDFFPAFHNLFLGSYIRFGEEVKTTDIQVQRKRLKKLELDLERQNFFERMGVSPKAKDVEVKRAYHELAKTIHPDRLGSDAPIDIRDLARKCFNMIQEANEVLSNPTSRDNYLLELEQGRAEKILEAEQMMEQARNCLAKGDVRRAKDMLEDAILHVPMTTDLRLLLMWAQIKSANAEKDAELVNRLKDQLSSVPPEDRHNAVYFFVKGLVQKASGDFDGARRSLEQSIGIEHNFVDAKRELNVLSLQAGRLEKPVDLLKGDLKDVLGALLGGKKKR
jgi:CheY-like chemotaxis protein